MSPTASLNDARLMSTDAPKPDQSGRRAGFGLPEEPAVPKYLAYIIVIATFCLLTIPFLDAAGVMDSVALGGKSVLIVRW